MHGNGRTNSTPTHNASYTHVLDIEQTIDDLKFAQQQVRQRGFRAIFLVEVGVTFVQRQAEYVNHRLANPTKCQTTRISLDSVKYDT